MSAPRAAIGLPKRLPKRSLPSPQPGGSGVACSFLDLVGLSGVLRRASQFERNFRKLRIGVLPTCRLRFLADAERFRAATGIGSSIGAGAVTTFVTVGDLTRTGTDLRTSATL